MTPQHLMEPCRTRMLGADDQKVWTPRLRFLHHSLVSPHSGVVRRLSNYAIAGFPRVATSLA
jgi:hypothetical protein